MLLITLWREGGRKEFFFPGAEEVGKRGVFFGGFTPPPLMLRLSLSSPRFCFFPLSFALGPPLFSSLSIFRFTPPPPLFLLMEFIAAIRKRVGAECADAASRGVNSVCEGSRHAPGSVMSAGVVDKIS